MPRHPFFLLMYLATVLAGVPIPSLADVTDSTRTGFTSVNLVTISNSADLVYERLWKDVSAWWDPAHTWSGDASNLSLDARAGGLFQEKLPDGGSVAHLEVVYVQPGKFLRMRGALGPLQGMAVTGSLTWSLTEKEGRTEVRLTYAVTGYSPAGLAVLAGPVDSVLKIQIDRLKRYIETGKP